MTDDRGDLARARHLGAAHSGTAHWWHQRLSALALIPLGIWFLASLIGLAGADHFQFEGWLARPFNALMMLLMLGFVAWHSALGLKVVIEDYVHLEGLKLAALLASHGAHLVAGGVAALAVLRIAIGN